MSDMGVAFQSVMAGFYAVLPHLNLCSRGERNLHKLSGFRTRGLLPEVSLFLGSNLKKCNSMHGKCAMTWCILYRCSACSFLTDTIMCPVR